MVPLKQDQKTPSYPRPAATPAAPSKTVRLDPGSQRIEAVAGIETFLDGK